MNIFFILVGVSFAGILAVFWMLRNEDKPSLRGLRPPAAAQPTAKPSLFSGLSAKFKAGRKSSRDDTVEEIPFPSVTDVAGNVFAAGGNPESISAPREVALSADEEKKIDREIDLTSQLEEWKGKYQRLDRLFNEKSAALEKSEESLQNELNNRKEFNKVKDILEKELKDHKDKASNIQVELTVARAETEGYKKRISQLEEKITKLEKTVVTAAPSGAKTPTNQSDKLVAPEERPQDAQDKPGTEGETGKDDQRAIP